MQEATLLFRAWLGLALHLWLSGLSCGRRLTLTEASTATSLSLYVAARNIASVVRFALSVRPSERGWNAVVLVL